MAGSNIGALPLAPNMADDSLLVVEQQGAAMKLTGAMLKGYAKQGVELEFQGDLEAVQAAADRAESAVSTVTNMTVSAHASDTATVTKSMQAGKVNLDFGLPRGEQGVPGPAGATGPRGPQGAPGNGLTILGNYDTEAALRAAAAEPQVGDAYGVGAEAPYDTYIFDGVTLDWKNYGPLSGGGGGIIPENVVTSEGGASLEIPTSFGDTPHVITFTDEEEPPLTASDVEYDGAAIGMTAGTVQEAVDELFTSVSDGKALIASAVTDKGVPTGQDATFAELAENIGQIQTGGDTSDATATPGDILGGKTAYTASGKVEGIIPSLPAQTITPGTADKTIANGQYLAGTQTIKGDPNLTSSNIKKGVSLFGVAGALESSFAATLTVKADIGAVVTATCGDTSLEALSTTGAVVLELPIEGTWKVTAVRGMAQYNTVTLEVSNQYNAELTAEVHIEYFMHESISNGAADVAAANVGHYVLFGGGANRSREPILNGKTGLWNVFARDESLTISVPEGLISTSKYGGCSAATAGGHVLFITGYSDSGEYPAGTVNVYDEELTRTNPVQLESLLSGSSSAGIGVSFRDCALFADYGSVKACNADLTVTIPISLITRRDYVGAAANSDYVLFAGGYEGDNRYDIVDSYDKNLTRGTPTPLSIARSSVSGENAGNYVLFVGGIAQSGIVGNADAYDLFLTRTNPEALGTPRHGAASANLKGFALFAGGTKLAATTANRYTDVVDIYDPYLVRTTPEKPLSEARESPAAAAIGDYTIFYGGFTVSQASAIEVASTAADIYRYV